LRLSHALETLILIFFILKKQLFILLCYLKIKVLQA